MSSLLFLSNPLWHTIFLHPRLRQSGKKKKKLTLHIKRPGGRKDEMKLALLKLKMIIHSDQTDGGASSGWIEDSGSDKGSLGPEGN